MVAKRLATENSWAQIDVALKRRHDLIPALVESVKGYASHERQTFENVAEARTTAIVGAGPRRPGRRGGHARAGDRAGCSPSRRPTPTSRPRENFSKLQDDLREAEDQIAITRRVYNDTVETYNTLIQVFPPVLVARACSASIAASSSTRPPRPRRRRRSASPPARRDAAPRAERRHRRDRGDAGAAPPRRLRRPPTSRDADVSLRLAPDGALLVTEDLTFEYDGHFEGSYRDIALGSARRSPTSR